MTSSLLAVLLAPSGQGGSGLSVLLFQVALIFGIFTVALVYARKRGPVEPDGLPDTLREQAEEILAEESAVVRRSGPSGAPRE